MGFNNNFKSIRGNNMQILRNAGNTVSNLFNVVDNTTRVFSTATEFAGEVINNNLFQSVLESRKEVNDFLGSHQHFNKINYDNPVIVNNNNSKTA